MSTRAQEAVSPVIGTIIMVAVAVVLSGIIFAMAAILNRGGVDSAPSLALTTDDVQDRIYVASVATGADWSRLSVKVSGCDNGSPLGSVIVLGTGASPFQNEAATSGAALNLANALALPSKCGDGVSVPVTTQPTVMQAGDYLELCSDDGVANLAATNVHIIVVDSVAGMQVSTHTFTTIAGC